MVVLSDEVCQSYLNQLIKHGEDALYKKIIGAAFIKLNNNSNPEYLLLDYSESFLKLYRRTGEEKFVILSKVLRRAAHVIYRELVKQNKSKPDFKRFLNAI